MVNILRIRLPEICRSHKEYESYIKDKVAIRIILTLLIVFYNLQDMTCAGTRKVIRDKKISENKQTTKIQLDQDGTENGKNLEDSTNSVQTHNTMMDSQYINSKKTGSIHSQKLSHIHPEFSGKKLKTKHKRVQNARTSKQIHNRKTVDERETYKSRFTEEKMKKNNEIGSASEHPLKTNINITVETSSYKIELPSTLTDPVYPNVPPISKYSAHTCQNNTLTPMNLTVNVASATAAAGKKAFQCNIMVFFSIIFMA